MEQDGGIDMGETIMYIAIIWLLCVILMTAEHVICVRASRLSLINRVMHHEYKHIITIIAYTIFAFGIILPAIIICVLIFDDKYMDALFSNFG